MFKGNLCKINLVILWFKRVYRITFCVSLYLVTMSNPLFLTRAYI